MINLNNSDDDQLITSDWLERHGWKIERSGVWECDYFDGYKINWVPNSVWIRRGKRELTIPIKTRLQMRCLFIAFGSKMK